MIFSKLLFIFFSDSFDTKKCFPIEIPSDDPFWKGRKTCMSFSRSLAAPTLKCSLEFQQQVRINQDAMLTQIPKNPKCVIESNLT